LKKLAVGGRWTDEFNQAVISYLEEGGIDVVGITKRGQWGKEAFAMSFEQGLKLALEVGREAARLASDAEAILVPAGATMSLHVIPVIEEEFGKPTFTRTSAEVWRNLVHPGIIPPVSGWGQLLASGKQSEGYARSEEEFGKPTFRRTSAEVWRNLVHPGIIPPVSGWGQLLASGKQSE